MEFANIYKGNYKLLVILPIILVVVGGFLVPRIELGIDFRSGTMITLLVDEMVDPGPLKAELVSSGVNVHDVKSIESTIGYTIEIELDEDTTLARAEGLKGEFFTLFENVSLLEARYIGTNRTDQELYKEYVNLRGQLNDLANDLFLISGYNGSAEDIENLNILKRLFSPLCLLSASIACHFDL